MCQVLLPLQVLLRTQCKFSMHVVRERVGMGPKRGWDWGSLRDETIWERSWWSQELRVSFGLGFVCGPPKNLVFPTKEELVDRLSLGADKLEHNRDTDELFSGEREPFRGPRNASVETDMMGHPPDQGWEATASSPSSTFPFPLSIPNAHPHSSAPFALYGARSRFRSSSTPSPGPRFSPNTGRPRRLI